MDNIEKQNIYNKIVSFLKKYNATQISVFGSYIENLETPHSDIDILVEFSNQKSLLELVKIEQSLSELIGIKVDLLTKSSISPYIYNDIKDNIKILYH